MRDAPFQREVVSAEDSPLGASDLTRRLAISCSDGTVRFAGLTRPEAVSLLARLAGASDAALDESLVEIALPVVVSDGAGPYLLDAGGELILVVGEHPVLDGLRIAMRRSGREAIVGVVRLADEPLWEWASRARVDDGSCVQALDSLVASDSSAALAEWSQRPVAGGPSS